MQSESSQSLTWKTKGKVFRIKSKARSLQDIWLRGFLWLEGKSVVGRQPKEECEWS